MAKAWGHSRSGIEGLRPDLISALAGGSVSSPSSASSAKPQSRCAAASVAESSAQVSVDYCCIELEQTELLLLLGIKPLIISQLLTHCCHQWKAVYKMESGGTVAT